MGRTVCAVDPGHERTFLPIADAASPRDSRAAQWGCRAAIVVAGAVDAWGSRFDLNPDGISYVEMARHALTGLGRLVNGYWSPGFPLLLMPVTAVSGADPATAIPALHLVNLCLFVATGWFWLHIVASFAARTRDDAIARYALPLGTVAYLLIALRCIGLGLITPDMGVMLAVLATAWCVLQLERTGGSMRWAILLGVSAGTGYWLKGILLPLNLLLFAILFAVPPAVERARGRIAIAAAVFAFTALPLVALVSAHVGRVTIGEVGKLNYAWEVDGVLPFVGWTGDSLPAHGRPLHPPIIVASAPLTLAFAEPIHATYPLWYEPSYWYDGVRAHFDLRGQWRVLQQGVLDLAALVHAHWTLVVAFVSLWLITMAAQERVHSRAALLLGAWSLTAALVYALVHVEPRYLAGFVAVATLAAWAQLAARRMRRHAIVVVGAICALMLWSTLQFAGENVGGFDPAYRPDYLNDAAALQRNGLVPGTPVTMVGDAFEAYAAFAAGLPIVAQVMDSTGYWTLGDSARRALNARLAARGVAAVLGNNVQPALVAERWRLVVHPDSSNLGVLLLRAP